MRILALRGENLASLAERFEIDFENGPLRGAGLFAITGETGAGKSTLLDALCLALYANFPRVHARGADEKLPDASGKPVNARDPRSILRNGASQAFAEVDFIGVDGGRYRATWRAQRARGRSAGNLLEQKRTLLRLAQNGAVAEALADGVTAVRDKIIELTDFTFDQFCRTTLLAQGDFDAFLRADEGYRAELLEKITGTEHYAAISRRVSALLGEARSALAKLEAGRDAIVAMDAATRAQAEARLAEGERAMAALDVRLKEIQGDLRRWSEWTRARNLHDEAFAQVEAARAALDAAEPERLRLADLEAAEAFRALFDRLSAQESIVAQDEATAREALGIRDGAQTGAAAAAARCAQAEAALAAAEALIEALEPVWREATELDADVLRAADDAVKALDAARVADLALVDLQGKATDAENQTQHAASAILRLGQRLDARPGMARLADGADEAIAKMRARDDVRRRWLIAGDVRAKALERVERLDRGLEAAQAAAAQANDGRGALALQIQERRWALGAIDAGQLRARAAALAQAAVAAQTLDRCVAAAVRARGQAGDAHDAALAASSDLDRAQAWHEAAERRQAAFAAERRGMQMGVDLAQKMDIAAPFRAVLIAGEPCPVCGARDHPFHAHDEGARAHAAAILARRDELDAQERQAGKECGDAQRAIAEAEGRRQRARMLADQAAAQERAAAAEFADAHAALMEIQPETLVEADVFAAGPAIAALQARLPEAQRQAEAALNAADALQNDLNILRDADARLERQLAEAAAGLRGCEADRAREDRIAAEQATLAAELRRGLDAADAELTRLLAPLDLGPDDLDRDPAAAVAHVEREAAEYARLRAAAQAATAARDGHAQDLAVLAARIVTARETAQAQTGRAAAAARELADKRAARGALLGGETTQAHRARYLAGVAQSRDAQDKARRTQAAAASALAVAQAAAAAAEAALAGDRDSLAELHARRARELSQAGADAVDIAERLAAPAQEREHLRARLAGLRDRMLETGAALRERKADLDKVVALGVPEVAEAELTGLETRARSDLETSRDELARMRGALVADDAAREKSSEFAVAVAAAKESHDVHLAVGEAIGSADGAKFRLFAQSVTLGHLLALANQHLRALAPRYLLERAGASGLGLQVVDRDMGEEVRSTRSLSGGERFLASLALALALAGLEGRRSFVDTLFIDEGFGTLDAETLDMAIGVLEQLRDLGRKVGVISHVAAMHERIPVQIRVEKRGRGRSRVSVNGGFGGEGRLENPPL